MYFVIVVFSLEFPTLLVRLIVYNRCCNWSFTKMAKNEERGRAARP